MGMIYVFYVFFDPVLVLFVFRLSMFFVVIVCSRIDFKVR